MKSRDVKNLIFLIFVLLPLFVFADSWIQTDWSGGDGYFQWQDPTGYYEGLGVNGWRETGSLTLFAPDFEHFTSIGKFDTIAMVVSSLYSDSLNRYYAGFDDISSLGNAKLCISSDFGNTWKGSVIHSTIIDKVTSVFLPSFTFDTVIFVGTNPSRIYKSIHMGDSGWVYMPSPLSGNYVSSILEIGGNGYLYASTVGTSNYFGKIWKAYQGNGWSPLEDSMQPYVDEKMPTGIFQFIMSKDNALYLSSYYNYNGIYVARIFRSYTLGVWELCTNLPDTLCRPFAMDIGYDTLGNYGIIYVGVEVNGGIGKVFRSTDDGNSWGTCGTLEGPARTVNGIKVDGDGTVYASVYVIEGFDYVVKVFRSTDMGLTWDTTSALGTIDTNIPTSFHQTDKGFLLVGTENEAEIFKSAYVDSGYLVSSVYDVGTGNGSSEFDYITWTQNLNGQHLTIKVRTDTVDSMIGAFPWNYCDSCTSGMDISELDCVSNGHRYIQYRVEFSTDAIDYSSELMEIEIKYSIDTIPPHIDTAYASDSANADSGIDYDDYVILIFDDATNEPIINGDNIDTVLRLSSGHSWIDTLFEQIETVWISPEKLKIWWSPLLGLPTVEVGDTIYPDSFTITDMPWENPCFSPIVLTGSFDPPGIAEDVLPYESIERVTVFPSISRTKVSIKLNIKNDSDVKISIFDITGRLVNRIVERKYSKGAYTINWYSKGNPSGIYFIKTDINNKSHIDKVTIVK